MPDPIPLRPIIIIEDEPDDLFLLRRLIEKARARRFDIPLRPSEDRRMKSLLWLACSAGAFASTACAAPLHELSVKDIDGRAVKLAAYRGKVLLIVNVASECGYTPQYQGLQELFRKYEPKGLVVLGFPCNQFGGQEPGTDADIKKFCAANYHVTFPMFAKVEVNGAKRDPLFAVLAGQASPFPGDIKWNFSKFLVGRDGTVLNRFGSSAEPDDAEMIKAVEAALAAK